LSNYNYVSFTFGIYKLVPYQRLLQNAKGIFSSTFLPGILILPKFYLFTNWYTSELSWKHY